MKIKTYEPKFGLKKMKDDAFDKYDYILKKIVHHTNTSNKGLQYTHYAYNFIDENKEECLVAFNDFIETESGFIEYWNGKPSGLTVGTKN